MGDQSRAALYGELERRARLESQARMMALYAKSKGMPMPNMSGVSGMAGVGGVVGAGAGAVPGGVPGAVSGAPSVPTVGRSSGTGTGAHSGAVPGAVPGTVPGVVPGVPGAVSGATPAPVLGQLDLHSFSGVSTPPKPAIEKVHSQQEEWEEIMGGALIVIGSNTGSFS